MILDPDNQYIQAINSHVPLTGAIILEIGCGSGRMTRDLALHAKKVVATDLDNTLIENAKESISADNIDFLFTPDGKPGLAAGTFDIVIYSLSLHHIPKTAMRDNLLHSARLLQNNGKIIVVEPGSGGSFLDLKRRFGAGSGDEEPEKAAAAAAIKNLDGWVLSPTYTFEVDFQFIDNDDFFAHKLPGYQELSAKKLSDLKHILEINTTPQGIILSSERYLNVLTRAAGMKK